MRKALATGLLGLILLAGCGGVAGQGPSPEPAAGPPAAAERAAGGSTPTAANGESAPTAANERADSARRSEADAPQTAGESATGEPLGTAASEPREASADQPLTTGGRPAPAQEVPAVPPRPVDPPGEPPAQPDPPGEPLPQPDPSGERLPQPELPGKRLPEPPGVRTPVPGPAGPTAPPSGERTGDPLPEELRGLAEDDVLRLAVVAVREESGLYRATATLTNKSGSGVDLLFDCGSLLHLRYPGRVLRPDPARICPAVYSRLFEAGATEQLTIVFDPEKQGVPQIAVVYETRFDGSARVELRTTLEPPAED